MFFGKEKNDKYFIAREPDSQFGIFDRNENSLLSIFLEVQNGQIHSAGYETIEFLQLAGR